MWTLDLKFSQHLQFSIQCRSYLLLKLVTKRPNLLKQRANLISLYNLKESQFSTMKLNINQPSRKNNLKNEKSKPPVTEVIFVRLTSMLAHRNLITLQLLVHWIKMFKLQVRLLVDQWLKKRDNSRKSVSWSQESPSFHMAVTYKIMILSQKMRSRRKTLFKVSQPKLNERWMEKI